MICAQLFAVESTVALKHTCKCPHHLNIHQLRMRFQSTQIKVM